MSEPEIDRLKKLMFAVANEANISDAARYRRTETQHERVKEQRELENERRKQREAALEALTRDWRNNYFFHSNSGSIEQIFDHYKSVGSIVGSMFESNLRAYLRSVAEGDTDINHAALSWQGKVALLPLFLGLGSGPRTIPYLDVARSGGDRLEYISPGAPHDPDKWAAMMPTITAHLGGGQTWLIELPTPTRIILRRATPMPSTFPFSDADLMPGHLYYGVDVQTREPVHIPFEQMSSCIIPGAAGFGKSNALGIIIKSVFANLDHFEKVYLVDGKYGEAFARYENTDPRVQVLWEAEDFYEVAAELDATWRRRVAARRDNPKLPPDKQILCIVDEFSSYAAMPFKEKKLNAPHEEFHCQLAEIAKRGRSSGVRLMITCQEPVDADIPTNIRNNLATIISFALPINAHAIAVFTELDGLPTDPRRLTRGRAIIRNRLEGWTRVVQFPNLDLGGR